MKTIATICARGGSKGLPGKNIRPLRGRPLIVHSIAFALEHPAIDAVCVSTDDERIARVAREAGAEVPYLRPPELARDDSPKLPVIEHLLQFLQREQGRAYDRVVDLQPTSPLRIPQDLDACLRRADEPDQPGLVLTAYDSGFNPYFNLVELQGDGSVLVSKGGGLATRQAAPPVWALNGSIYVCRRAALSQAAREGMWSVRVAAHIMPASRSVDIDTAEDFAAAERAASEGSPAP